MNTKQCLQRAFSRVLQIRKCHRVCIHYCGRIHCNLADLNGERSSQMHEISAARSDNHAFPETSLHFARYWFICIDRSNGNFLKTNTHTHFNNLIFMLNLLILFFGKLVPCWLAADELSGYKILCKYSSA